MHGRQLNVCDAVHNAVGTIVLVAGIICILVFILSVVGAFYFFKAMKNPGGGAAPGVQMGAVPVQGTAVQGTPVKAAPVVASTVGATSQPEAL
jgi:hypothetical protein